MKRAYKLRARPRRLPARVPACLPWLCAGCCAPALTAAAALRSAEEFTAHNSTVNCVKIGRRSSGVMVTGGDDKNVNMWAIGKPHAIVVRPLESGLNDGEPKRTACTRSGARGAPRLLARHAPDPCVRLRRADAPPAQSLTGHQSGVECVAFDAAEEAVVAGAAGGTLKIWDIAAAKGACGTRWRLDRAGALR